MTSCSVCGKTFGWFLKEDYCRNCNRFVCSKCAPNKVPLPGHQGPVRVCMSCYQKYQAAQEPASEASSTGPSGSSKQQAPNRNASDERHKQPTREHSQANHQAAIDRLLHLPEQDIPIGLRDVVRRRRIQLYGDETIPEDEMLRRRRLAQQRLANHDKDDLPAWLRDRVVPETDGADHGHNMQADGDLQDERSMSPGSPQSPKSPKNEHQHQSVAHHGPVDDDEIDILGEELDNRFAKLKRRSEQAISAQQLGGDQGQDADRPNAADGPFMPGADKNDHGNARASGTDARQAGQGSPTLAGRFAQLFAAKSRQLKKAAGHDSNVQDNNTKSDEDDTARTSGTKASDQTPNKDLKVESESNEPTGDRASKKKTPLAATRDDDDDDTIGLSVSLSSSEGSSDDQMDDDPVFIPDNLDEEEQVNFLLHHVSSQLEAEGKLPSIVSGADGNHTGSLSRSPTAGPAVRPDGPVDSSVDPTKPPF